MGQEKREQLIDLAVTLMDAAVLMYKINGISKEDAYAEVKATRSTESTPLIEQQMEFIFETSWEKING